ncbi:unnamed protein product, partial [Wuchereria bancrofti]
MMGGVIEMGWPQIFRMKGNGAEMMKRGRGE